MALIICYVIGYVQIMSAGFNLWGVDPRMLIDMPLGRNTLFVGLFLLAQFLGLAGAVLMFQKIRLGFILSIAHHIILLPALVITSWGLVMLMDDRFNATLLFMMRPTGSDVSFFWSLGWGTVFSQVTRDVPTGSMFFGINLFAFACATVLWIGMDEMDSPQDEREMQIRRRPRQPRRDQLALPAPQQPYPQQPYAPKQQRKEPQRDARPPQRMPPQQAGRPQPARTPPRGGRDYQW